MSAVLELNDQALCLYQDGQLIASSPGYVLALGKTPSFGADAAAQSRLHPLSTNNEFWHRLGMDPLPRPLAHFRHHADIAHAHLQHLAALSDYAGPVTLVVPGNFSREQLGVLTGILRHSPFSVLAMADAGVMAAASRLTHDSQLVFLDLQLHQTVLTRLSVADGRLRRESVSIVQGVGWDALSNSLVQTVNDAFIAQARFNPQHSARWEQQLHNELPDWLEAIRGGARDIQVVIETDQARHQAVVLVDDMLADIAPALDKIDQQLHYLAAQQADPMLPVWLSTRAALVPGLQSHIQHVRAEVAGEQMAATCARLAEAIAGNGQSVPYITSVRLDAAAAAPVQLREHPTHVLVDGYAWPLNDQRHLSDEQVSRVLREHRPGDVIHVQGRQLQLIRVQHGIS